MVKRKPCLVENCSTCGLRAKVVLCDIAGSDLAEFEKIKRTLEYAPHQTVFYEGHLCLGLYVLCSGKVKLTRSSTRGQRQIVNNGQPNYSINRDAHEFIRGARAELMFACFPRPDGLAALRQTEAGWREVWVRGDGTIWDQLIANQRGKLGDDVASKEHYLQLVGNFLSRCKHIGQWAISHTEDGFLSAAEIGDVIQQFRRIDVTYNKDFSDVIGGRNTFLIIA